MNKLSRSWVWFYLNLLPEVSWFPVEIQKLIKGRQSKQISILFSIFRFLVLLSSLVLLEPTNQPTTTPVCLKTLDCFPAHPLINLGILLSVIGVNNTFQQIGAMLSYKCIQLWAVLTASLEGQKKRKQMMVGWSTSETHLDTDSVLLFGR